MPTLSITLPSIYPAALERALHNLDYATRCEYEVIVVSPTRPGYAMQWGGKLIYIEEKKPLGCSGAHSAAFAKATGEFVCPGADDHVFVAGWDVVALRDFKKREALFHERCPDKVFCLGLRHVWPAHVGSEFGIYYPYFPFMRRHDAIEVGGWLSPSYKAGFSDSDLGLRIWSSGGRCEWSREGLISVTPDDGRKSGVAYTKDDMAFFLERWAPKYGARDWDLSHIRGFNLDITPERHPYVVDRTGRSIYYNDHHFKTLVGTGG